MHKAIKSLIIMVLVFSAFTVWAGAPNVLRLDFNNQVVNTEKRAHELDETLWTETLEGDLNDWEFIDANTHNVIYWQTSDHDPLDGNNWRCYDPAIGTDGGYDNHWLQWLNSPVMDLSGVNAATLSFSFKLICETPTTAEDPYDGWDAANVWVSEDGGENWEVIAPATGEPYNITSAFSFGSEWQMGPGIPGWGNDTYTTWSAVTMDLTPYVGNADVRFRFAFCSDPADCSAEDHADWTGFQVDNVVVTDGNANVIFSDDADGNNVGGDFTTTSGLDLVVDPQLVIIEDDDAVSPTHVLAIEDIQTRFTHYYQYNGVIDLSNVDNGNTYLDVYVRGAWSVDELTDDEFRWTLKVKPAYPDSNVWYYATNPFNQTPNMNYVFIDAPENFTQYSVNAQHDWDLTPYHGMQVQIRVECTGPLGDFLPGEKYIQFDDFSVENVSYDHDIGVTSPIIPFPLTVGMINPATVTYYNNGVNAEDDIVAYWNAGTSRYIFDPAPQLQPEEEMVYYLDNDYEDGLDGFMPSAAELVDFTARLSLRSGNDEDLTNNVSETVSAQVWPMGVYEFGYDDRMPKLFYDEFEQGEGPLTHFTLQDDYTDLVEGFDTQMLRVMWNGDLESNYDFNIHIYGSGETEPGDLLYSTSATATPDYVFPSFQEIDLSDIEALNNIQTDFWVWIEITDQTGFPHICRSQRQGIGEDHHYNYDGQDVTTDYNDYFIRVVGTNYVGVTEYDNPVIPDNFELGQAYPNPFNPTTAFSFKMAKAADVRLAVFNTLGQEVDVILNREMKAGTYKATWNANNRPSGVYFIQMEAQGFVSTQKVMLLK